MEMAPCRRCGGAWLPAAVLEAVFGSRHWPPGASLWWQRRLPCPECARGQGTLRRRMQAIESSGGIVDRCVEHGLWLDTGELGRLLAPDEPGLSSVERFRDRVQATCALLPREQRRALGLDSAGAPPPPARAGLEDTRTTQQPSPARTKRAPTAGLVGSATDRLELADRARELEAIIASRRRELAELERTLAAVHAELAALPT